MSVSLRTAVVDGKSVGSSVVVIVDVIIVMFGKSGVTVSFIGALLIVPTEGAAVPVPRNDVGET